MSALMRSRDVLRSRLIALAPLLLGAAWLACSDANAQAHGPPATEFLDVPDPDTPETHAAKVAELDVFLRRLVGRFRDTRGASNYSERLVDCVAIGVGAGVQCMNGLGSRSDTGGAVSAAIFGLDPRAAKVNFLRVNAKGIAEGGQGHLSGDTLYLKFPCTIPPDDQNVISCEARLQYYAQAHSNEVSLTTTYIKRVRTPRGIVEQKSTGYVWLNRRLADNNKKGGSGGK